MVRDLKISVGGLEELPGAVARILDVFPQGRIFCLYGELGAGKTTTIKQFCRALRVTDTVTSPSFAIVNEYAAEEGQRVYHFDLFRINKPEEVFDIGMDEYLSSGSYCFLEWPEKISGFLPDGVISITISRGEGEEEREMHIFQ